MMGIAALFAALNTLYNAVANRVREIATLRALGFGGFPVVVSVLVEAMILGAVGGFIGGVLALVFLNGMQSSTMNFQTFSQMTFAFTVTPKLMVTGIIYGLMLWFIAGILPASGRHGCPSPRVCASCDATDPIPVRRGAGTPAALRLRCAQARPDWADVEGRIQYAYYTNDARALNGVLNSLKPKAAEGEGESGGDDAVTRSYFRALAHYRLAQVFTSTRSHRPDDAIDECGEEVDHAVEALPKVPLGPRRNAGQQSSARRGLSHSAPPARSRAGR